MVLQTLHVLVGRGCLMGLLYHGIRSGKGMVALLQGVGMLRILRISVGWRLGVAGNPWGE